MLSEMLISLRPIFETISIGLEIIGVIIIVYAAIITLGFLIKAEIRNRRQAGNDQHETKIQFTTRLLTALEFFIAADIIKTILSPDAMTLLIVGVTIAIRAVLTFLLHKEQKYQKRVEEQKEQQ